MTTSDDIIRIMKEAGIARGKCDTLKLDESLAEQGMDSYDRMSLVAELEEAFDIEIPDDVASGLTTINAVVDHINQK